MGIGISLWTIFFITAFIAAVVILLGRLILKDFRKKPVTGTAGLTGETGIIQSWNGTSGHIYVHGELWKAVGSASLRSGETVKVKSVKGLTLTVEADDGKE